MKKGFVLLVTLLALVFPAFAGEVDHYCDDEEAWAQWRALLVKYPADDALWAGYALRMGLCEMVTKGEIDTQRAINIFENYLDTIKKRTAEEEAAAKKGMPL